MRVLLGLILLIGSIVFLLFGLAPAMFEDSRAVLDIMERFYCKEGEELTAKRYVSHDSDGTSYSADFFCTSNDPERQTDVTGTAMLITFGGFSLMLTLSIIMFILSGANTSRRVTSMAYQTVTAPPSSMAAYQMVKGGQSSNDLTAKLKELQEAYDQNLISKEEYDRMRESILKQF